MEEGGDITQSASLAFHGVGGNTHRPCAVAVGVSARDGGRGGSAARRTTVFQLVGGSPDLGREGLLPKRVRKEPSHLRMSGR